MATPLTSTVASFRRLLVWAVLILLVYFVISTVYGFIVPLIPGARAPIPTAENRYGLIPKPHLDPRYTVPTKNQVNYVLETVSGNLPAFPDILPVFPVVTPKKSLLVSDLAKAKAPTLGFGKTEPIVLSPSEYQWRDEERKTTLRLDIINNNYTIKTDPDALQIQTGAFQPAETILRSASFALEEAGKLDSSFGGLSPTLTYLKNMGDFMSKVESASEGDIARVDFFRELKISDKVKYPIYGPSPFEGPVQMYFAGGISGKPFEVNFKVWQYDFLQGSTYPLENPIEAWEGLQDGEGVVAALTSKEIDYLREGKLPAIHSIVIRTIGIAYFDDPNSQSFLQPISIFIGQAFLQNGDVAEVIIYKPLVHPSYFAK